MDTVVCLRAGLITIATFFVGCCDDAPTTYEVTGRVTYQENPLPSGNIMFVPDSGPAAAAAIGPDGFYTLKSVAGTHRVVVTATAAAPADADETNYQPSPPLLPPKFGRAETSGVSVTVQPNSENAIDIRLVD